MCGGVHDRAMNVATSSSESASARRARHLRTPETPESAPNSRDYDTHQYRDFAGFALAAGAGDDVGALTCAENRRRWWWDRRALVGLCVILGVALIGALVMGGSGRSEAPWATPAHAGDYSRKQRGDGDGGAGDASGANGADGANGAGGAHGAAPTPGVLGGPGNSGPGTGGTQGSGHGGGSERRQLSPGDPGTITVYVSGAVKKPGVYTIADSGRVADAVEVAGGLNDEANPAAVNLAATMTDGQQIHIPTREEHPEGPASSTSTSTTGEPAVININTADATAFDSLPGIGPALARDIVAFREKNGPFSVVDDLLNVPGIGPSKLERMRDYVRVS